MMKISIRKIFLIILAAISVVSILFIVSTSLRQPKITVAKVFPANGTESVSTSTSIYVTFTNAPTDKQKQTITPTVSPQFGFTTTWLNAELKIIPNEPLQKGTKYSISVSYNSTEIYKASFETEFFTAEQIQKYGLLQSQADYRFGQAYKNFLIKYPWYTNLPIEKSEYRTVYDLGISSFRIRLKITPADNNQKQILVQQALADLKTLKVAEPIKYYVLDVNGNQL